MYNQNNNENHKNDNYQYLYYKNFEEENEKLKNDIINLKIKLNEEEKKSSDLKIQYKLLKEEYLKRMKELNDKNMDYNDLIFELKNYQKRFIELNESIKEKEKKIYELIFLNGKLTEENVQIKIDKFKIEKQIEELEKYKNKAIKLENAIKNKNNILNKNETKIDFIKNSAEKYYDLVIDINSINSLKNEGWEIKYNKERKEIYHKIINEETLKIGVLGLNNVGKSYLLSKMVRVEIPTGYSIETKGISIKYSQQNKGEEKGVCILDSAGFESPLLKNEHYFEDNRNKEILNGNGNGYENENKLENYLKFNKIKEQLSRDKAHTERLIEQIIISLSDMIILVIGKLTRTEQRLITRIKNLAKKNDNNKINSIIIVHNLAQYNKIIEVEKHISQYLTQSATFELKKQQVIGIKKYENRHYFVEKPENALDIDVYHYIMAKEGTEAGDYYNDLAMELIKSKYNIFTKRNKIDIPRRIINIFSDLSEEILGEKINSEQLEIKNNIIKFKENNYISKNINNSFIIQNSVMNQDGNYLQRFEPKYSLYFYKDIDENNEEEKKYLLLRIEIPGNIVKLTARSTDPQKEKYNGIVIKGIKERDKFPEQSNKYLKEINDNRNYDEFSYFIELKPSLILNKMYALKDTEIYKFKFNKKNKEKEYSNKKKQIKKNSIFVTTKEVEGDMIDSGVYIMKFDLTEGSYL